MAEWEEYMTAPLDWMEQEHCGLSSTIAGHAHISERSSWSAEGLYPHRACWAGWLLVQEVKQAA